MQKETNKRQLVILLILASLLSVGFADCGFVAGYATYSLKVCPPKNYVWPNSVKSENLEITVKVPESDASNTYACRKLIRYQVKEKIDKNSEFDNYVGILRNQACTLIVATGRVVPNLPKSALEEEIQKWGTSTEAFVKLLLKDSPYVPKGPPEKVELIGGKSEYIDWCKTLSLP